MLLSKFCCGDLSGAVVDFVADECSGSMLGRGSTWLVDERLLSRVVNFLFEKGGAKIGETSLSGKQLGTLVGSLIGG